jgi:hypothetical protein
VVDARAVIEGLVILASKPKLRRFIGTGAVALWEIFRFTQTIAGFSAAAARHAFSSKREQSLAEADNSRNSERTVGPGWPISGPFESSRRRVE